MIVVIYQCLIISIFAMLHGMHAFSIVIRGSEAGLLGENGTEIECLYTREQISRVLSVTFMAFKRNSTSFDQIATYIPGETPTFPPEGQYLKGRVTLTPLTQLSNKTVMTFNKLMCIDETIYRCEIIYQDLNSKVLSKMSNNRNISVQVPPLKPNSVSIVNTPEEDYLTSAKHIEDRTSPPSTENNNLSDLELVTPNDTTSFNNSTLPKNDYNATSATPTNVPNSTQHTTTAKDIAEGDNITIVCKGHVGNPPAEYFFQKYRIGHFLSMNYTATETNLSEIAENCSYYRTSSFTFQVTAKDNNASIRCVVNSFLPEFDKLYIETVPIEVNYEVRMPNITKYPNKEYYVVGKDSSIHLTCKSDGNPQPEIFWYKENIQITASENLTIKVMNKTDSGEYTCRVSNTVNGQLYTNSTTVKVDVRNEDYTTCTTLKRSSTNADTSTLPSSSTGTSSGTGEKHGNQKMDLKTVIIGVVAAVVFLVLLGLLGYYLLTKKRKGKDESTENNGSANNLMHYSSKHGRESRPGAYDSVVLEGDAPVMSSGKKEQNVEAVRKHNEKYMKKQTNEEKNESKSPTPDQPVIYAEVNKATKSKNRQETSNQQDDDTYAGAQEGIYDQSGNRRHKENENAEQFDKIGNIKEQNSTDDTESSVKSNQKGSYVNQALSKGEKQVATVPPISRSSVGSQGYKQTSELSQKEYENVKGTDNTHTSTGQSINQTSF